jgi:hypothetical protein
MTKSDYLKFRNAYIPEKIKTIFIAECPPVSGGCFERLFIAMMRDVLDMTPASKVEGLKEFAARGYFLIDATYTPVNRLSEKAKEAMILGDFPMLLAELNHYAKPETGIVLVKANVCRLLKPKLQERGFHVLNRELVIPFPASGQQGKFRIAIRQVLGL